MNKWHKSKELFLIFSSQRIFGQSQGGIPEQMGPSRSSKQILSTDILIKRESDCSYWESYKQQARPGVGRITPPLNYVNISTPTCSTLYLFNLLLVKVSVNNTCSLDNSSYCTQGR